MCIQKLKSCALYIVSALMIFALLTIMAPAVYADTDGSELRTTAQPDRLVLDLGADWAGIQFELKLDTATFPFPVAADSAGVLTMELGGSNTYTLTRLDTAAPAEAASTQTQGQISPESSPAEPDDPDMLPSDERAIGFTVPPAQLIIFLVGLILAVGGLLIMRRMKNKRENYAYDDDDESDGDDEYP